MASKRSTVDAIVKRGALGGISARKMFGEYGLYASGTFFGLVCDDRLFLKPTPGARALLGDAMEDGVPYPGAKPHLVVPEKVWDDGERLAALVRITVEELPPRDARRKPRLAP